MVDSPGDSIIENANEGTDLVVSSITYALGANVENVLLTSLAAINGTGNELDNTLFSGAGNNVLDGGSGTDTRRTPTPQELFRSALVSLERKPRGLLAPTPCCGSRTSTGPPSMTN